MSDISTDVLEAEGKSADVGAQPLWTTIFHEPWWLDAVAPGTWAEVTVSSNGKVVARLPYVVKRIMGAIGLTMPPITHVLGPQLPVTQTPQGPRLLNDRSLINQLWEQLPRHHYFSQTCDPMVDNCLATYALGYDTCVAYTLRIPAGTSKDKVWKGMRSATRRLTRIGEKTLSVDRNLGIDEFCHLYAKAVRHHYSVNWSKAREREEDKLKIRVYEACRARDATCLMGARDEQGQLQAAIMPVWWNGVMYYLLTARRPEPAQGAVHLLVWEAVKLAMEKKLTFDFDGFLRPDGVNFLSGFGGEVHNRLVICKQGPLIHLARAAAGRLKA